MNRPAVEGSSGLKKFVLKSARRWERRSCVRPEETRFRCTKAPSRITARLALTEPGAFWPTGSPPSPAAWRTSRPPTPRSGTMPLARSIASSMRSAHAARRTGSPRRSHPLAEASAVHSATGKSVPAGIPSPCLQASRSRGAQPQSDDAFDDVIGPSAAPVVSAFLPVPFVTRRSRVALVCSLYFSQHILRTARPSGDSFRLLARIGNRFSLTSNVASPIIKSGGPIDLRQTLPTAPAVGKYFYFSADGEIYCYPLAPSGRTLSVFPASLCFALPLPARPTRVPGRWLESHRRGRNGHANSRNQNSPLKAHVHELSSPHVSRFPQT